MRRTNRSAGCEQPKFGGREALAPEQRGRGAARVAASRWAVTVRLSERREPMCHVRTNALEPAELPLLAAKLRKSRPD